MWLGGATMLRLLFSLCASTGKRCSTQLTFGGGSPIDMMTILGRQMYLKRDDLLALSSDLPMITGNKARKLWSLYRTDLFPSTIVSLGGEQSNAMRALALLCQHKGARFIYVVRDKPFGAHVPPFGNLLAALRAGMQLVKLPGDRYKEVKDALEKGVEPACVQLKEAIGRGQHVMYVPMGAGGPSSAEGVQKLCNELKCFIDEQKSDRPWRIILSGGTCSTAYYLSQHLRDVGILVAPCGAGPVSLLKSLHRIHALHGGEIDERLQDILPDIKLPSYSFGEVNAFHFYLWKKLCRDAGIEFDLVYAPRTFDVLLSYCNRSLDKTAPLPDNALENLFARENLIYYHCGGVEGNAGQLERYQSAGY